MRGGALVVGEVEGRGAVALVQPVLQALRYVQARLHLLVALGLLLELGDRALERAQVREDELGLDGVHVGRGVHELAGAAGLAHDVGILEEADDLADGVAVADVRQELVAEALALVRALDQACDVNELDGGRHDLRGMHHLGELVQALVGNVHDAHVGVDRGEGVVGREPALAGQRGEQGRLAHVGQTYDTD